MSPDADAWGCVIEAVGAQAQRLAETMDRDSDGGRGRGGSGGDRRSGLPVEAMHRALRIYRHTVQAGVLPTRKLFAAVLDVTKDCADRSAPDAAEVSTIAPNFVMNIRRILPSLVGSHSLRLYVLPRTHTPHTSSNIMTVYIHIIEKFSRRLLHVPHHMIP
jgi:hypothetical protein